MVQNDVGAIINRPLPAGCEADYEGKPPPDVILNTVKDLVLGGKILLDCVPQNDRTRWLADKKPRSYSYLYL